MPAQADPAQPVGTTAAAATALSANIRLEWHSAAGRTGRLGDPGALESAEPGRTAARLVETLRASRVVSASDIPPDTSALASFAAALSAPPTAVGAIAAPPPQDRPPAVQLANPWPVDDPAFARHLAAQVQDTLLTGIERAEIAVTPPSMGPIRIELSLSGEQASVAFSATLPDTCRAIEQSLPLLETMLSKHGLVLAEASVGTGSQSSAPEHGMAGSRPDGESGARDRGQWRREQHDDGRTGARTAGGSAPTRLRASRGLLDLFA